MSWLIISWFLTVGFMPQNTEVFSVGETTIYTDHPNAMYQTIGLEALAFDHLRIWSDIRTYEHTTNGYQYYPFRSDYQIGLDLLAGPVTIGVKHECDHPVIWNQAQDLGYLNMQTEVFVRIKGSTKW